MRKNEWGSLPRKLKKLYQEWRVFDKSGAGFGKDAYYWYLQDAGGLAVVNPRVGYRAAALAEFRHQAPGIVLRSLREAMRTG